MRYSLPNFPPSIGARRLVVIESNSRVFHHMQEALDSAYALHQLDRECSLTGDFGPADSQELPGVTVLDWDASERSVAVLEQVLAAHSGSPVLLLLTAADERDMKETRPAGMKHLEPSLLMAQVEEVAGRERTREIQARLPAGQHAETLLTDGSSFVRLSKRMRELEAQAAMVARADIPVLILGESGTGKEILSKYVHTMSPRSREMFLKVNCAAMPADLLESELFGYEQGAFTGAVRGKPGKFEICDGGTIFLDEIGEMPAVLQAKLLHVLQDGTYSRLGSRTPMHSNVRVIAATNVDMKAAIANKTFREDLYYRLNGFSLTLPPLRDRRDEIGTFAHHFMQKGAKRFGRDPLPISTVLLTALTAYSWPGNLREMENVINRYLVMGDEQAVISELTPASEAMQPAAKAGDPPASLGLKQLARSVKGNAEAAAIAQALEETHWNRKKAAVKMQVSYKTLLYKIKQYGLEPQPS